MPMSFVPSGARRLAVGRIAFLLDGADLRYVTVDGVEQLRRVSVPVRDAAWGTLEPDRVDVEVTEAPGAIEVRATGHHVSDVANVSWRIDARATAAGTLDYAVTLTPGTPFDYARMGICLLHPPERLAGRGYAAETPQGRISGRIDPAISPQRIEDDQIFPLFPAFSELHVDGGAAFRFEGDLFEMEDQRNWSDGSFKTYCTPLSVPRPHRAEPSRPVVQRVAMSPPTVPEAAIALGAPIRTTMPSVGLALPVDAPDEPSLHALGPGHLRVDVREPQHAGPALAAAAGTGARLIVALHLGDASDLDVVADALARHADAIAWVLALDAEAEASTGPLVRAARERLAALLPHARFAGGTDQWFAQLNRHRPDIDAMDGVAWSVTPQVHGFDALTVVEGLAPQADQIASARAFAPGLELLVGPVTLRPRYNPAATDAREQALHPPPESIDPRQRELFAAAWLAASLGQLARAGADAVTCYETHGPRGVLPADGAGVLPCWHALADACDWHGWDVLAADAQEPLAAQALAVRDRAGGRVAALVANLRDAPTAVPLSGLPAGRARVRTLDAATCERACADPHAFRAGGEEREVRSGALTLALDAHAVATVLAQTSEGT